MLCACRNRRGHAARGGRLEGQLRTARASLGASGAARDRGGRAASGGRLGLVIRPGLEVHEPRAVGMVELGAEGLGEEIGRVELGVDVLDAGNEVTEAGNTAVTR